MNKIKKALLRKKLIRKLCHIVAIDNNGLIGVNNKIPWGCKEDMNFFKTTTTGHVVVMGRNTWNSMPYLHNRFNIVISSSLTNKISGSNPDMICRSLDEFYNLFYTHPELKKKKVFIIGGRGLYRTTLSVVKNIIISHIPLTVSVRLNNIKKVPGESIEMINNNVYYPINLLRNNRFVKSKRIALLHTNEGTPFGVYVYSKNKRHTACNSNLITLLLENKLLT